MGVIMVIAAVWAPQIANFGGLFKYIQEMLAYMVPPVTVLFLLGVFWKGGTPQSGLATLLGGHLVAIALFLIGPDLHFTLVAGVVFGASMLIYLGTSMWGETKSDEELVDLMVQSGPGPQPGLKNYKLQSALLLGLTAILVGMFW